MPSLSHRLWTFLSLAGLFSALPTFAVAQTATVRRTILLHTDSAVTSRSIERLARGAQVTLLSTAHPNGYYNVRTPDDSVGWVYGRYVELDAVTTGSDLPIQLGPGVQGSAQTEGCGDGLWAHVYNPSRLLVKTQCVTATGRIVDATHHHYHDGVRHEGDGDTHGWLELDPQYKNLLDAGNMSDENGNLVFEIVCHFKVTQKDARQACEGYQDSIAIPPVGSHVTIKGTFVQDNRHAKWNEIHPVTGIAVDSTG
jgi:hypothetical protein